MEILPDWIAGFFITLFGLAFGSFVTALSWRLPRNISILKQNEEKDGSSSTRSFCPKCRATLGIKDLIPVFSWLFSKGKCRHCKTKISSRYPLTELGTAIIFLLFYFFIPEIKSSWALLAIFAGLGVTLMTMIVIDFEHKLLPNSLNLTVGILGLFFIFIKYTGHNLFALQLPVALMNMAVYSGLAMIIRWVFLLIMKKDPLGGGDIKFFAAAGIWLSFSQLPVFMFISGFSGVIIGIIWKKTTGEETFPFGPALILAFISCLLLSENIFQYFL